MLICNRDLVLANFSDAKRVKYDSRLRQRSDDGVDAQEAPLGCPPYSHSRPKFGASSESIYSGHSQKGIGLVEQIPVAEGFAVVSCSDTILEPEASGVRCEWALLYSSVVCCLYEPRRSR